MDEPRRRRRRGRQLRQSVHPLQSDLALSCGVVVLVVLSMLLVGAVHVPAILALSLLALAVGASACLRLRAEGRLGLLSPTWIFVGLGLYCVLQALPLPQAWWAVVAPHSHAVWESCLRPLGEPGPTWHSLSIDTGATWVEAAKWLTYGAVFSAALVMGLQGKAVIALATLMGSALLASLLSALHLALGATRLYGIYEPLFAVTPWGVAPLLNPNNLSGYLLLGTFAGFALALMRRPIVPRAMLAVAVAGVVAVMILTGSRGGVAALAVGLVLLLAFLLFPRPRSRFASTDGGRKVTAAGVLAVGLAGAGLAALAASGSTWAALQDESFSKLSVVRSTDRLVADNWLWGVGRGAFETAFPPYRAGFGRMMFQYPENFVVQWLSEWGVVVSLLAFGALLWTVRPWRVLTGPASDAALAVGMLALLLQNLVDLGLEVLSVGIAFVVALGTLVGSAWRNGGVGGSGPAADQRGARPGPPIWVLGALAGVALLVNVMGWAFGTRTAVADRQSLRVAYEALPRDAAAGAAFNAQLRAAILRHPGDSYLPLLGALAANRLKRDPVAWINRALERDPERGAAHFLWSQVLLGHGSIGQGMLALRYAVLKQPEFLGRAAKLVVERATTPEQVWAAVPEGTAGTAMLLALALVNERSDKKAPVATHELIEEASRRDPSSQPARLAEAKYLLKDLEGGSPTCSQERRAACLKRLDAALRVLENSPEESLDVVLVGAQRRALDGGHAEASRFLSERCPRLAAPVTCLRARASYALDGRDAPTTNTAITAYLAAACTTTSECAKAATWVGDRMEERGDWNGAIEYYSKAVSELPSRATWRKLANAARAAGHLQRAHEADERARGALDAADP